jgi:hypothetical protein
VRRIAYREAARARLEPQIDPAAFADTVAGRRVGISRDGGRIRRRERTRGAQTNKGQRRSRGAWRALPGVSVSVVDAEGQREASLAPVMDAPLTGPDAVCALLRPSWQRRAITHAEQGRVIADGAPWIWKRLPLLGHALGLAAEQVQALLALYQAVPHLGQVAALRKDGRAKARARWRTPPRRFLLPGQGEQGIAAVQALCRGRHSKAIRPQRAYVIKHQSRMA